MPLTPRQLNLTPKTTTNQTTNQTAHQTTSQPNNPPKQPQPQLLSVNKAAKKTGIAVALIHIYKRRNLIAFTYTFVGADEQPLSLVNVADLLRIHEQEQHLAHNSYRTSLTNRQSHLVSK